MPIIMAMLELDGGLVGTKTVKVCFQVITVVLTVQMMLAEV